MKNKKITYFLIVIVLLVWGIIFYRFFKGVGEPEGLQSFRKTKARVESITSDVDSNRQLILHYRDPFLGTAYRASVVKNVSRARGGIKKAKPKPEPVIIDWSFAQLIGIINSHNNKNKVVILKHREKEYLIKEGERIEEMQLQKIFKDSIKVNYMGQSHIYRKI